MIVKTDELIEAVAKAICLKLDAKPLGSADDPRSGASVPNWAVYKEAAEAAIDVVISV